VSDPVRVLRLTDVPPVRSQALYHALGHTFRPGESPDTILLVTPGQRYVSIGYHQELEREVDTDACRELELVVVRREPGGGAVLLDSGQVFTNWVFAPRQLPAMLEDRFRLYVEPLVQTYQDLGIDAVFRPVNDIQVAGRKIGGTGAARMFDAEVVVGSLMFDFDHVTMARVLRVSSAKMRDKVAQALSEYMTTMHRELGETPDQEPVVDTYLKHVARTLGRPVVPGELTPAEEAAVTEWEERLAGRPWTERKTRRHLAGIRISEDVRVYETEHKAPGGLLRATTTVESGRFVDVVISGDFTVLPGSAVDSLESALVGCAASDDATTAVAAAWLSEVEAPGVTAGDIAQVLRIPDSA
jgi:lipoate---protein ligase